MFIKVGVRDFSPAALVEVRLPCSRLRSWLRFLLRVASCLACDRRLLQVPSSA
jgi:hypothetical protein